jgi:hypothetical protein
VGAVRRYETSIDIGATPGEVWTVLSEIERWPEWTASISSVHRLDAGPLGVGGRARVKQPRLAPANFVVTTWDEGRGFDWVTTNPAVTAVGRHWIEPVAAGARVTLAVEFRGPLARIIAWLYGGLTTRYVRMEAEGLKRRAESTRR